MPELQKIRVSFTCANPEDIQEVQAMFSRAYRALDTVNRCLMGIKIGADGSVARADLDHGIAVLIRMMNRIYTGGNQQLSDDIVSLWSIASNDGEMEGGSHGNA